VLTELGLTPAHRNTFGATLRRCGQRGYRDQIATACFNDAAAWGDVSLCLYDVTTLYFEAEKEDEGKNGLWKVGYSNYAEVSVMPRSLSRWRCSCWSAGLAGAARAA